MVWYKMFGGKAMNNNLVTQWYRPLDIIVKGVCSKDNPFLAELKGEFL